MMMHSTSKETKHRRKAGKGDLTKELLSRMGRILDNLNAGATIVVRRMTTSYTLSTNGSGAVSIGTLCSSGSVNGYTDFASMAGLYAAYRVKGFRVRLFPVLPFIVAGVAPPPALVAVATFTSGLSTSTYANVIDSAESRFFTGFKPVTLACDWSRLNDAQLWTPNNAAVPSSENYGLYYIGATGNPAAQVSTVYWQVVVEAEVEWITAG